MMKKMVALILTLVLVLSITSTLAEEESNVPNVYMRAEDVGDLQSVIYIDKFLFFGVSADEEKIVIEYNDFFGVAEDAFVLDGNVYVSLKDLLRIQHAFEDAHNVVLHFVNQREYENERLGIKY